MEITSHSVKAMTIGEKIILKKVRIIQEHKDVAIISNNIQLFGDKTYIEIRQPYIDHLNRLLKYGRNDIDICQDQRLNYIPTLSAVTIKKGLLIN